MSVVREQLPYDPLILPHDADADRPARVMLEPPHVVPIEEGILAGAAVDCGNAISSELQCQAR